ncbi:uncharacterized protein LOC109859932 isoform X4 [Pseudomyrmex gracilis]|uniref:uncharacterized protein LOC109859932 isoform X4 n=1 Tax=Pseudomyrmex gracilis TaxID=219809 RepID=UPI0009957EDB|nr:uncharacterized protein LOC109859932 isoform X4 [Pseudomyrmex gracilis]
MSLADVLHRQSTQLTIPSFYPIPDCFAGELRLAQTKIVSSSCIYKEKRFFLRSYIYKVRRCSFCQRLGHTASSCKKASSDKQFCERCGKSGYSKPDCLSDVFECINCIRIKHKDYKHQASDAKCHAYMRQKDTHKLMATRDLLFREASELFDKEGLLLPLGLRATGVGRILIVQGVGGLTVGRHLSVVPCWFSPLLGRLRAVSSGCRTKKMAFTKSLNIMQ